MSRDTTTDGAPAGSGVIVGGSVLVPGASRPGPATLRWTGTSITAIDDTAGSPPVAATVVDAAGAYVLPGAVDLHGDGFERAVMPRPGVFVDIDIALGETSAQLLAAGVTTAYVSATDSWEPGLRSRATLRSLAAAIARRDGAHDLRLHVRHERCNTDGHDELAGWIDDGTVALLSFNDHTPEPVPGRDPAALLDPTQVGRSGRPPDELGRLLASASGQRRRGADQELELARTAVAAGCPVASHDVESDDDLQRDLDLGVSIAEFPVSLPLAQRYVDHGLDVVLGAPNLLRGRSHLGNLSVRTAIADGLVAALCSDYHYPSLLHGPFLIAGLGLGGFGQAWERVSMLPARAAGLDDRGQLRPGLRADLVVVEPPDDVRPAHVVAVVCGGRVVYHQPGRRAAGPTAIGESGR